MHIEWRLNSVLKQKSKLKYSVCEWAASARNTEWEGTIPEVLYRGQDASGFELFAIPLGDGAFGSSGGSGVDIFMESGDCDLEFTVDSGCCEFMARAFLIADGPSGIDD